MKTQKNATPTKEQQRVMEKEGLIPHLWTVIKDLQYSMIVRHRVTGEFKQINK